MDFQRHITKLPESDIRGYGSLIGMGYDTLVESFNMDVEAAFLEHLACEKKRAQEGDVRGKDVANVALGKHVMHLKSHGAQGTAFILTSPEFTIDFRSPKTQWNITVRYSAAGLWQYGAESLRQKVQELLLTVCTPRAFIGETKKGENFTKIMRAERWCQVSSVHYAFDFYSQKFTQEMKPGIFSQFICHSSSKKNTNFKIRYEPGSMWGRGDYLETFTLGNKKNLEVQIYDKGKEIVEASGKEWMVQLWEREGYYPPDDKKFKHVWRLELRFGKEFLDARGIKDFEEFDRNLAKICAEGIFTKRLTQDNGDARIRRRPLHPLWAMAARAVGSPERMLALGKVDTMAPLEKATMLEKQAAGVLRNVMYLRGGEIDQGQFAIYASELQKTMFLDPQHTQKCEKIGRKYEFAGRAR